MTTHPATPVRSRISIASARLLGRQPAIGKLLATAMGLVEVAMLEVLNFNDTHISRNFKIGIKLVKRP